MREVKRVHCFFSTADDGTGSEGDGSRAVGSQSATNDGPSRPSDDAISVNTAPLNESSDGNVDLSGIGSTTVGHTRRRLHSLEDVLSLDEDSEGKDDVAVEAKPAEPIVLPRGFLLPRSPARFFLQGSLVQSAVDVQALATPPSWPPPVQLADGPPLQSVEPTVVSASDAAETQPEPQPQPQLNALVASSPTADARKSSVNLDSGVSELIREHGDDTIVDAAASDDDFQPPTIASSSGGYNTTSQPSLLVESPMTGNLFEIILDMVRCDLKIIED